ncbi:hypothetical protein ElyMa_002767600 [Elysia marginata]|uniref:Uncharacterized protein n=1 Tax=Elysia marginata TaxID=1093978 RepID=A0AAV4HNU6_9GAST|nr:hypothetical protein ElyMa_002767600 [Elysia marginata]
MSMMTAHAQQDSRSHAPFIGPDSLSDNRTVFGCLSSATAYRPQHLLQPVPIPLQHYLPFHHHHHPQYFFPGSKMGISARSDRAPPLSPPIADAVPSTLPLTSPMSNYGLSSSGLDRTRDLPLHGVYDSSHISSSFMLRQHNRLTARENERNLLSFLPNATSINSNGELSRWAPLFDLDIAAAHYYHRLGTSDHRLMAPSHADYAQKNGPGYGLISPVIAQTYPLSPEYLRRPGGVLITDLSLSPTNSLPHPVRPPSRVSELPVSKSPSSPRSSSSIAWSIPSTMPSSLSSSSSSPTSTLSRRTGVLTLSSPSCTATTTIKPNLHPSSYSLSLRAQSPKVASPPLSPMSNSRHSDERTSRSPRFPNSSTQSQSDYYTPNHLHQVDSSLAKIDQSYYTDQPRPYPDKTQYTANSLVSSASGLTRKHLWSQSDFEPLCKSPKRPALNSSLSMPAGTEAGPPSPKPPRVEDRHTGSLNSSPVSDNELSRFAYIRDNPSPSDGISDRLLEDRREMSSPSPSSLSPQSYSPMDSLRRSLHGHLLISTKVKTERLEPWPVNGSIVTGIPPARYSSRCSMFRYDSYCDNSGSGRSNSSNGRGSPSDRDARASPGKELPTRTLKQERVRDRQEVTSALEADREHAERFSNIKKCASTQT